MAAPTGPSTTHTSDPDDPDRPAEPGAPDGVTVPDEVSIGEEVIDQARARELLERNTRNRNISGKLVADYASDMIAGRWVFVGDPIRIAWTGDILDGQHRLKAIVVSDTAQRMIVIANLPPESQRAMDLGRKRTVADNLRIEKRPNGPVVATICRNVMKWERGTLLTGGSSAKALSDPEVMERIDAERDAFERAGQVASAMRAAISLPPSGYGVAFYYLEHYRSTGGAERLAEFTQGVVSGEGLAAGDPRLALRNTLIRRVGDPADRVAVAEMIWLIVRAHDLWVADQAISRMQLPTGGVSSLVMGRMLRPRGGTE